jgi:hypothetical protein
MELWIWVWTVGFLGSFLLLPESVWRVLRKPQPAMQICLHTSCRGGARRQGVVQFTCCLKCAGSGCIVSCRR